MLEDVIAKKNSSYSRAWGKGLRIFQCILLLIFVILEGFGLSLSGVLWDTDRTAFWQYCLHMAVVGLPLAFLIIGLQYPIHKLTLQYDYELQSGHFSAYKVYGNRRKRYVSFEFSSVRTFKPLKDTPPRGAVNLSLNDDAERRMLADLEECLVGRKLRPAQVVLELNEQFYAEFSRNLRGVM